MGVKMRNTIANGGMTGRDKGIERVFAYRQGNSYSSVKAFTKPANPQSTLQTEVRNAFTLASAGWSGLTQEQRNAWENTAPEWLNTGIFGIKKMSGQNLYIGCNIALTRAGLDTIDEPSTRQMISQIGNLEVTLNAGVLKLVASATNAQSTEAVQVAISAPRSLGTSKGAKLTVLHCEEVSTNMDRDITASYVAKYGSIPSGAKIYFECRTVSRGGNVVAVSSGVLLT